MTIPSADDLRRMRDELEAEHRLLPIEARRMLADAHNEYRQSINGLIAAVEQHERLETS